MVRYHPLAQRTAKSMKSQSFLLKFGIAMFVVGLFATTGFAQLPDFRVDANSITFSNPTPVEGEEITIWVAVKNVGEATPTMNEDLVVELYEGDPATEPIQIVCKDVILELKPGETDTVKAQWQTTSRQDRNLRCH